jgi:hypothetical protein
MTSAQPTNDGLVISRPAVLGIADAARAITYRCPVCGRMVDAGSSEEILLHHEHVTHPGRFFSEKSPA